MAARTRLQLTRTAYHKAGHVVACYLLTSGQNVVVQEWSGMDDQQGRPRDGFERGRA